MPGTGTDLGLGLANAPLAPSGGDPLANDRFGGRFPCPGPCGEHFLHVSTLVPVERDRSSAPLTHAPYVAVEARPAMVDHDWTIAPEYSWGQNFAAHLSGAREHVVDQPRMQTGVPVLSPWDHPRRTVYAPPDQWDANIVVPPRDTVDPALRSLHG